MALLTPTTAFTPPLPVNSQWTSTRTPLTTPSRQIRVHARLPPKAVAYAYVDLPTIPPEDPSSKLFSSKTFASLGLTPELVTALTAKSITQPTGIQSRGIPPILGGADVILGAATGSGKTLAYLLPVFQMLKQAEMLRVPEDPPLRVTRRPRAVVLLPTRELAEQVVSVAKELSHVAKLRVVGAVGGSSALWRKLKEKVGNGPTDLLIGTTGRIGQLVEERLVDLRFVEFVVVDEVDTMFDAGFEKELATILKACRRGENKAQYIAAGATHPRAVEEIYQREFPNAKRINVDLHRPPPGLVQRFIEVNSATKLTELLAFLGEVRADGKLRGGRMMVFCNTIDSCRFLDHFLQEGGYSTACIHGDVPPSRRDEEYGKFKGGERDLLICTDMAARGLDNLKVEHVVLFDFPNSAVDYLHRAGRTARGGAVGRVTSFVTKRDLTLARALQGGGGDALECARVAREGEESRKKREEESNRENERRKMEGLDDVARSGKIRRGRSNVNSMKMGRGRDNARGGGMRGKGRGKIAGGRRK